MPEVAPHPHRTFQQIAASFGDKHVPGRLRRPLYNWATAAWRAAFRIDRHERRIAQDFARGLDGFHHDHWIFENFYFSEFVATTLLEADGEAEPARKAAQLIRGALAFRDDVLNDRLPQEFEAGKPLDMQRYRRLFSRLALQVQRNGKDVQKMTDCAPSDYVVVAVCGLMYRLQCVEDGHSLAYEELARQLGLLLTDARSRSASSATPSGQFGLLTVLFNRKHGKLYRELMAKDRDGVEAMNRALFCVAIDLDSEPTTLDQALRASHSANYRNRDHRRSLQVVVSANRSRRRHRASARRHRRHLHGKARLRPLDDVPGAATRARGDGGRGREVPLPVLAARPFRCFIPRPGGLGRRRAQAHVPARGADDASLRRRRG